MIRTPRHLLRSVPLLGILLAALLPWSVAGQSAPPAGSPAAASAASGPGGTSAPISLVPVSDPAYGLSSVAPAGWVVAGPGIRARKADAADPTLLALQSAPMSVDALWQSLLPQLGLTAIPEPAVSRTTEAGFSWQLYQVPVKGAIADIAVTEASGTAYLVLLLSMPSERDVLAAAVFLPAVDALAPFVPERTPLPSGIGYSERDVTFPGGAPEVTLAGTLTIPDGDGPHPGIVLMTGSGAEDRDESIPGMALKPFAVLADALAKAGIAVLRYDDRGTAASTGDYASATIDDFTADGAAALRYLRSVPEVHPARAGILGHSEGGAYVAHIGAEDPSVAFVVGLAPMVRPGVDLLIDQNGALVRSQGGSDAEVADAERFARELYDAVLDGDHARAEAVMRDYLGRLWDRLSPDDQARLGDRDTYVQAQVDAQLPGLESPWFRSVLLADPARDWARVTAPVLALFGGKDVQVVAGPESQALEVALGERDPRSRIVTIPGANHLFQAAHTGAVTEYPTLEQAFTPELLPHITSWLREVTGLDG